MNFTEEFAEVIVTVIDKQIEKEQVITMIETPKYKEMGDLAFPCFSLAKHYRKPPKVIAQEISKEIQTPLFEEVKAVGGYVNVYLNKTEVSSKILTQIITEKEYYGSTNIGQGGVVTIDLSSPNIAKPFSMGHLRSTVIGNSLGLVLEKCGYKPVRINYLGDWGTQFGKLIVAYQKWGSEGQVRENPIQELFRLYVHFHKEAENDPSLNDRGREAFKKLEDGDEETLKLWKWFREESLKEFMKIYNMLGISFDSNHGEAFYNDKMDRVVQLLEENNLLEESDGAQVVNLEDSAPCLIKKRDGTTLYATRDVAAAIYRQETYHFVKSLYVVGHEQTLHFKQLFKVLEKMGYEWHAGLAHIPFGMILKDGKKMSTRKGKTVLLEEVLKEAIELAEKGIKEKNPDLASKDEIARQVGVGAVIFHDLKIFRMNNIEFSLEDMLRFEGETAPYVQYTHARACSLLRRGNDKIHLSIDKFEDVEAWPVISLLMNFPGVIQQALKDYDPSKIAKFVIELSRAFNKYYATVKILDSNKVQERLALVYAVKIVLNEGLRLLGIESPEEM
ncbi:arginine--tRNA ligase [Ornithinibacillus sp. L9]|uniref:Arginine--tRNA ligase n=1 Tax=Ornithinibacillus caprae TaxID=2678566 RepID=A0A6N8FNF5_9BACI|nr:arginine--tRNA ligase [Ornithinibacillus caprae]MUK90761.1 arginine--tRNA ligase [Ornithinibacillus caprae]